MHRRLVTQILLTLAAGTPTATAAGCTVNGKPLWTLGAQPPPAGAATAPPAAGPAPADAAAPAEPAGAVPPAARAWCKGLHQDSDAVDAFDLKAALDPHQDAGLAVPPLLQALCFPTAATRGQEGALEAARRRWMRWLVADERGWATDIVAWGNLRHADRMAALRQVVYPRRGAAWSAASPLEQWAILRPHPGDGDDAYYLADALPPTQAGRLGMIERCLAAGGPADDPRPVEWAVCQPDIDALDLAQLAAELRAEAGRPLADRVAVRVAAAEVQRQLPQHAARVRELVARDPAYARLFELANAARAGWQERAASRAELLAALRAMEDAHATGSRKARAGCSARAWPLFAAAVGKLPARRFENLRGEPSGAVTFLDAAIGPILQDPDAYLAATALVACEGAADHLTAALAGGLARWPGFRGPRTAALTAIQLAGLEPDRRDETIVVPGAALPFTVEDRRRPVGELPPSAAGVIAAVTDRGDTVRVTFPATSQMQDQCASRRRTHRISRIDDSGNVVYESVCTRWRTVRVDTTLPAIDVPKRYAAGLARGRHASIVSGVPEAVWARPSAPAPLAAFGALLR